ncbi:MAG: chromate transporter [Azospirillum sp.]|nr:chromate transporter [Azospirillum sp.]
MLLELFWSFFKVGLFTFGGGYAMIPLLQAELIERKKWLTEDEIMDYYSIGQCTPGIIAVNVSTFTGYKLKGIAGALVATAGIIAPSLIIIMTLANILNIFFDNPYVVHAFTGIRVVVIALMLDVVFGMWKKNIKDKYQWLIFILAVAVMIFLSLSPVWVVAGAAAFGLFMQRKTKK